VCLAGARRVQKELLEKFPSSKVRVYAIWVSMLRTDARLTWRWTGDVLSDQRVAHFWDENKIVGRWYAEHGNTDNRDPGIVLDAYYLYGPDAEWRSKPDPLLSGGGTIRDRYDELQQKLAPLLASP